MAAQRGMRSEEPPRDDGRSLREIAALVAAEVEYRVLHCGYPEQAVPVVLEMAKCEYLLHMLRETYGGRAPDVETCVECPRCGRMIGPHDAALLGHDGRCRYCTYHG